MGGEHAPAGAQSVRRLHGVHQRRQRRPDPQVQPLAVVRVEERVGAGHRGHLAHHAPAAHRLRQHLRQACKQLNRDFSPVSTGSAGKWSCLSTAGGTPPLGYPGWACGHARQPRQTPSRGGSRAFDVRSHCCPFGAHPACEDHAVKGSIGTRTHQRRRGVVAVVRPRHGEEDGPLLAALERHPAGDERRSSQVHLAAFLDAAHHGRPPGREVSQGT
jgi:hypothetical protein